MKLEDGPRQEKRCPKCGYVIPAYVHYHVKDGGIQVSGENRLICEQCARDAMPPKPPVRKWRKGDQHPDQAVIDVPQIEIK